MYDNQQSRVAHLWQSHKEGLHICAEIPCSGQVSVHLPTLAKLLEAVVELAGHYNLDNACKRRHLMQVEGSIQRPRHYEIFFCRR